MLCLGLSELSSDIQNMQSTVKRHFESISGIHFATKCARKALRSAKGVDCHQCPGLLDQIYIGIYYLLAVAGCILPAAYCLCGSQGLQVRLEILHVRAQAIHPCSVHRRCAVFYEGLAMQ